MQVGAEPDLLGASKGLQRRWMQLVGELLSPGHLRRHRREERRVGQQPGHLVLVLVGHELEQSLCHGLAELGAVTDRALLGPYLLDDGQIPGGNFLALVGDELAGAALDEFANHTVDSDRVQ